MKRLTRWCTTHRRAVFGGWLAAFVLLAAGVGVFGTSFNDSGRLPNSESATAYSLLARAGSNAASGNAGTIVWTTKSGSAVAGSAQTTTEQMLANIAKVKGVEAIVSPFTAAGASQVSKDGRTAYATVEFASKADTSAAKTIAKDTSSTSLTVLTGGTSFTNQDPNEMTEMVGVIAALIVLLVVFGSMWAAALPIITAVCGVAVSSMAVLLLSHLVTMSATSLSLGALIGLGVGIDYALLIVNRQIHALRKGSDVQTAIASAMNTSGRSVIFAGGTVMAALLGMLVLGFGFLSGMAIGAALTVLLTVGAAVTLLPALMAKAGPRVLRRAQRAAWRPGHSMFAPAATSGNRGSFWSRWSAATQRRPVATSVAALAVLAVLATPALSLRLGASDASSDPAGSVTRSFNDVMAAGFGKGYNADLLLVAKTPDAQSRAAFAKLAAGLPAVKDVAAVSPVQSVGGGDLELVVIQPRTAAQAAATSDLVASLRNDSIKQAQTGSRLHVYVGGATASNIDYANALTSKLPIYLVIIAVIGFTLLMLALRSLLVPLLGAISNILSIAVALGVTVALFQWGWGPAAFGVGGPAPVHYIVLTLIVGVIFGLSMDYQVFLAGQIREEWTRSNDAEKSVHAGITHTGKVIATAATIMFCVFLSFGFSGQRMGAEFGVGLAIAVLADAFLMRLIVMPTLLRACGRTAWAFPAWLDRALPKISIEGSPDPELAPKSHTHTTKPVIEAEPVEA